MLRKETVSDSTLALLKELMKDEMLKEFFLVGGTALSLRIGHRTSIDLDLFSLIPFDVNATLEHLEFERAFRLNFQDRNTLKGQIANVQVDLISHRYPLVKAIENIDGVRLASLEDIAAMKLNAIVVNGTRVKDFVDVACLSGYLSLSEMLEAYEVKYNTRNPVLAVKALTYHTDINHDEAVSFINSKYDWNRIAQRLNLMIQSPQKKFSQMDVSEVQKQEKIKPKRGKQL